MELQGLIYSSNKIFSLDRLLDSNFEKKLDKITIRFYQHNDYEKWKRMFSEMNPKQNQWDWEPELIVRLKLERFKKKLSLHSNERKVGNVYYFCVANKLGDLIGIGLIDNINYEPSSCEIGFQLNNKFWGNGYGSEIAKGLVEIAIKELHLSEVITKVNIENKVSIRVLEKIGMKRVLKNQAQYIYEVQE